MSTHTDLIDKVNDAKTQFDRTYAQGVLDGWLTAMKEVGRPRSCIEADEHSMARFGEERPICWGVLLDWEPS